MIAVERHEPKGETMRSDKPTIEGAIEDFNKMRSFQPFKLGGKWFIAQESDGFVAYRTKKAAFNNTTSQVWMIDFSNG